MMRRVAVITDAASAEYFFPVWHRYYGGMFGAEALHVVTYHDFGASFRGFELGGLISEDATYDDDRRAIRMSGYIARLLETHDIVIRCDVDEFLVPVPSRARSLRDYILSLDRPYVTAIGLDLVEGADDEMLDFRQPILGQRPWCVETSSLSKTAIVTPSAGPVRWAPGFHAATVPPRFDGLYLLHTKFADVKGRVAWFSGMCEKLPPDSAAFAYYDHGKAKIEGFAAHLNSLPRVEDAEPFAPSDFRERFLASVARNPAGGIWQGNFEIDSRQLRHRAEGF